MPVYSSDLLNLLAERGHLHQVTDAESLDALAARERVTGYIGFDATAPSLHVGSLVQIMLLRRLQQTGHRPIVLMGGGTTRIGDPSGKEECRRLLDSATIAANITSIARVFERFLDFEDEAAILADNDLWLSGLDYVAFLRDIGPHFTINRMLTFDSVRLRLEREQALTFLEFNYMILQAYDFLELHRRFGCRLQLGGSDQWGNIVNGIELARRIDGAELFGITSPLVTTADGAKMGKSEKGAVWLNPEALSSYEYWQFWRNTSDADVGRFLRLFTELPIDEITRLEALGGAEINHAKKILADAATSLAHGQKAATGAAETARTTFEQGGAGEALPKLEVAGSIALVDALIGLGLAASKNEARRLIAQGGARVDGKTVSEDVPIEVSGEIRISAGKKKHGVLVGN